MFDIRENKGFGLVEVLVAIAIVGTAMVLITSMSLRSMKVARKNELQNVAVEVADEAMDFLKEPVPINTTMVGASNISDGNKHYFYLEQNFGTGNPPELQEIRASSALGSTCNDNPSNKFRIDWLAQEGIVVCRQIAIEAVETQPGSYSDFKFDVETKVVWKTIDGDEERFFTGYRFGTFQ